MRASSFVAGLAVSSVVLFGCPSQSELCKQGVDQVCERAHECLGANAQAAGFGADVDACKTALYANPRALAGAQGTACDDVENDKQLCANLGSTGDNFDLGPAKECSDARAALSCQEYMAQLQDPSKAPASCAERCK